MTRFTKILLAAALIASALGDPLRGEEPMQWHANPHRNNIVKAKDLPDHLGDDNRLWQVELNNRAFFNIITIENGRVYCGTRTDNLPERQSDRAPALLVLDLKTGKPLWYKRIGDRGKYGLATVPLIEGDRIYVRHETVVMCLDMDGNTLWEADAGTEYRKTMHGSNQTPLIVGNYLWVPTGHATGSDCRYWYTNSLEWPWHPNIMVFDKRTGDLVAQDDIELGGHQHGNWGSISSAVVNGQRQVFWGDAHGIVHAIEAPDSFPEGKVSTLKEVWRCDANPKQYRVTEDDVPMPYAAWFSNAGGRDKGWCEIIATPVYHKGTLYVALGRDKAYSHQDGKRRIGDGGVTCIDPTGKGDVTDTHKEWFTKINRTFCTPSITEEGLLFIADHAGWVNCLDINQQGKLLWKEDIKACIWNYWQAVGDDKIYVMNEQRDFHILQADRDGGLLYHEEVNATNNPQAGMTDGILIVGTNRNVTAYGGPEYMKTHAPIPSEQE